MGREDPGRTLLAGRLSVTAEHAAPTSDPTTRNSAARRYAIMLATAAVVAGVDHLTKWLVASHLSVGQQVPATSAFVNIHYIRNAGAAFGLLPQFTYLYLVVAAVVAGYILLFGPRMGGGLLRLLALGCLLGGSVSNGVDRLVNGYVVDFIDFHFFLFQIFNCADMAIVGGILVVVYEIGFSGSAGGARQRVG
jgi:signal peptidase II